MWRKQVGLTAFIGLLAIMQLSTLVFAEEAGIWLVYDSNMMPEPNEEITVYIHSEPMLFCIETIIEVTGDANITTAISEADCNNYGWDNGWNSDPYIDPDGWLYMSDVSWEGTVNGTVGYFKFRYYGGEVSISIGEESSAYDANCQPVLFSGQSLVFGIAPNESSISGGTTVDSNEVNQGSPIISDYNSLLINSHRIKKSRNLPKCSDSNGIWDTSKIAEYQNNFYNINNEEFDFNQQDIMAASDLPPIEERETIIVASDITCNTIWTANNVYYIVNDVNVQALLVIEPGTIIYFYPDTLMIVNNGGTLISSGTPDNPIIYSPDILYPDWGSYYQTQYFFMGWYYYLCPICIDETASPATTVTYSFIEGALVGISLKNIKLDHPIENNYISGNIHGISEYGTKLTDIINNLTFHNGWAGIEVYLRDVNGIGDPGSVINIKNNTCYSDYFFGIDILGVQNEEQEGLVILSNNIVTNSGIYGVVLEDGYVTYIIDSTGYYNNNYGGEGNGNRFGYEESNEYNPVYETEWPFVEGTGTFPWFYLNPNSTFVNASDEYIEQTRLIGKSTDINGFPDTNKVDLGHHYPNWDYSNAGDANGLTMDLNADLIVDFKDLAILESGWRTTYDINDFGLMADNWLKTTDIPPIAVTLSSDPNLVSGDLLVSINEPSDDLSYYLYLDGQHLGRLIGSDMEIPTYELRNGIHEIKVVAATLDEYIIADSLIQINVQNKLYCLTALEAYRLNEPYQLSGFYEPDGGRTINLQIKNLDDNTIWSNTSSGDFYFIVPAGILDSPYNQLIIQETTGLNGVQMENSNGLVSSDWPESWIKTLSKNSILPTTRTQQMHSRCW